MEQMELDINEVLNNLASQVAQLAKEKALLETQVRTLQKRLEQSESTVDEPAKEVE